MGVGLAACKVSQVAPGKGSVKWWGGEAAKGFLRMVVYLRSSSNKLEVLGPSFLAARILHGFMFLGRRIVCGFVAGFCFPYIFCGKSAQKKRILQENLQQNPPKSVQQKSLTYLCRGVGPMKWEHELAIPEKHSAIVYRDRV